MRRVVDGCLFFYGSVRLFVSYIENSLGMIVRYWVKYGRCGLRLIIKEWLFLFIVVLVRFGYVGYELVFDGVVIKLKNKVRLWCKMFRC